MNIILSHKKRCLDARTNLFYRFEDWLCKERKIKKTTKRKQTSYNCRNNHKLMNCRVNII